MKKVILAVLMVAMFSTLLCACGKFKCDLCGKEKSGKKYKEKVMGQEVVYCKDCHDGLENLLG